MKFPCRSRNDTFVGYSRVQRVGRDKGEVSVYVNMRKTEERVGEEERKHS